MLIMRARNAIIGNIKRNNCELGRTLFAVTPPTNETSLTHATSSKSTLPVATRNMERATLSAGRNAQDALTTLKHFCTYTDPHKRTNTPRTAHVAPYP